MGLTFSNHGPAPDWAITDGDPREKLWLQLMNIEDAVRLPFLVTAFPTDHPQETPLELKLHINGIAEAPGTPAEAGHLWMISGRCLDGYARAGSNVRRTIVTGERHFQFYDHVEGIYNSRTRKGWLRIVND